MFVLKEMLPDMKWMAPELVWLFWRFYLGIVLDDDDSTRLGNVFNESLRHMIPPDLCKNYGLKVRVALVLRYNASEQ